MKTSTKYFNPNGIDDNKLIGNHTGFVNFNDTNLKWTNSIYKTMLQLTWFAEEVNVSNEGKNFSQLLDNEKMVYKLVFANLSFLDSAQESHILDFRQHITHPILKACLTRQAFEESIHSNSYATVLQEIGNSDEVFDMYKTEDVLMDRNRRVSELFARYVNSNDKDDILGSAMASVLLEGVLFLSSFIYVFHLGDKMQGSRDMVAFIARDETTTHTTLFGNIYKNLVKQNNIKASAIDTTISMMMEAVQIELDFARHITTHYPIMGLDYKTMERTIHNFANDRLKVLGLNTVFKSTSKTMLQVVMDRSIKTNDVKTNFFEGNNKNYSKGSINMDDF